MKHPVNLKHHGDDRTFGQRAADGFAKAAGSWRFIIIQSIILAVWILLNVTAWIHRWDIYPFILLNLCLSFQAAYAAPIIMMSQNRQAARDRDLAEHTYEDTELLKQLLQENTTLTQGVHNLSQALHDHIIGTT